MALHRIIRVTLLCVLLCLVNLSECDIPKENTEARVVDLQLVTSSETSQPSEIDCQNQPDWKNGDDDNAVSVPPDVCGLCPQGNHDLEPCECTSMAHKLAGLISITCNSSTHWTTMDEIKEMFVSVDEYLTTHVFRFNLTGTNVTGTLNGEIWGPLDFRQIIMDNNKIRIVDNNAFIQSKDMLTLLSLKNNEISYFHWDHLQDLPHLYQLILQGNKINFIPSEAFPSTDLTYLDLSRNFINHIGPNAFDKLHKLRKLNLSQNKLESLDDNMFTISNHNPDEYNDLQIILSNNYISYISTDAFSNVHPVVLDLSHNLLTTLEYDVFMPLIHGNTHFLYIKVTGNPIVCDCNVAWLTDHSVHGLFSDFECYDELGPTGGYFHELHPDDFIDCYEYY